MKNILVLLVAVLVCLSAPSASAQQTDTHFERSEIAQDLGRAGRLRLQSQRLAKLYLQIGLGLNGNAARRQLSKGHAQFEADLHDLSRYARNLKTRQTLTRTGELWLELKAALATPYNNENMQRVNYLSDDLMLAAGRLTMQIEDQADTPIGRLLDLSLRQGMLAQRLAKLYLLAQAGDRSRGRLVDVEQTRKEFTTALRELNGARDNTPASREALELASTQWLFFEKAIEELSRGESSNPLHVATTSERILEVLGAVSAQYAQDYTAASTDGTTRLAGANTGTHRN